MAVPLSAVLLAYLSGCADRLKSAAICSNMTSTADLVAAVAEVLLPMEPEESTVPFTVRVVSGGST